VVGSSPNFPLSGARASAVCSPSIASRARAPVCHCRRGDRQARAESLRVCLA
jgi:hypothetical protein